MEGSCAGGEIDRVTELSNLELGLMTVMGLTPAEFKQLIQQK